MGLSGEGQILTEATFTSFVYISKIYMGKIFLHSNRGGSI